ncbi:MAG: hypothetical protein NVV74_04530 [Magnetospirillum sp.]|nr:hypothetical protein [Magnetospirillum sp.]
MTDQCRTTRYISLQAVNNLTEAADFSYYICTPLNRFITIHCEAAGIGMSRVHRFRSSFLKHAGDWLYLNNVPFCHLWVLENPSSGGLNLHILMHVPPTLAAQFARRQRGWLKAAGAKCRAKVILSKWIGPRDWDYPLPYVRAFTGVVLYLLKGASPETCEMLSVGDVTLLHVDQGVVHGKRCGVSETLGPKARATRKFYTPSGAQYLRPLRPIVLYHAGSSWAQAKNRQKTT